MTKSITYQYRSFRGRLMTTVTSYETGKGKKKEAIDRLIREYKLSATPLVTIDGKAIPLEHQELDVAHVTDGL